MKIRSMAAASSVAVMHAQGGITEGQAFLFLRANCFFGLVALNSGTAMITGLYYARKLNSYQFQFSFHLLPLVSAKRIYYEISL